MEEQFWAVVSGRNRRCVWRVCETCGEKFAASLVAIRKPARGRFCSKRCRGMWQATAVGLPDNAGAKNPNYKHGGFASRRADRRLAWGAVRRATASGRLKRQPCEKCGATARVHGHHHDYRLQLDVKWLCERCHGQHHSPAQPRQAKMRFVKCDAARAIIKSQGGPFTIRAVQAALRSDGVTVSYMNLFYLFRRLASLGEILRITASSGSIAATYAARR